jgi:hypothetical protein
MDKKYRRRKVLVAFLDSYRYVGGCTIIEMRCQSPLGDLSFARAVSLLAGLLFDALNP